MKLSGDQIKVGDELTGLGFNSGKAQVKTLTPYVGTLLDLIGQGSQIASFAGTSIEMTLCAKSYFDVTRVEATA